MLSSLIEVTTVISLGIIGYAILIALGLLTILLLIKFLGNLLTCFKNLTKK